VQSRTEPDRRFATAASAERRDEQGRSRRRRAAAALVAAAIAPFVVFNQVFLGAIEVFHWDLGYLVGGWSAWLLVLLGAAFFVPVVLSIGRSPYSRWFMRTPVRHAYQGWGGAFYLMGVILAVEMSQVARI
jgi:hypothetical protein